MAISAARNGSYIISFSTFVLAPCSVHTMDLSNSISRFASRNSSTKSLPLVAVACAANGLNVSDALLIEEFICAALTSSDILVGMAMSVRRC